jgi:hypothetical protein
VKVLPGGQVGSEECTQDFPSNLEPDEHDGGMIDTQNWSRMVNWAGHTGFDKDSHDMPLNVVPDGQDAFSVEIQALPSNFVREGQLGAWAQTMPL